MSNSLHKYITLPMLIELSSGRDVYVWGAGNQGRGIAQSLLKHALPLAGFIDSAIELLKKQPMGLTVFPANEILRKKNTFIILASFFHEAYLIQQCSEAGLKNGEDFISYKVLKPLDYAIEVSGACNLHCLSCPRAQNSLEARPVKFMDLETFKRVLDKVVEENPFLGNIQLYQWGEPFLNPQLPEIIAYTTHKGLKAAISSNLNCNADYEKVIRQKPEWLRISCSGINENYNLTHAGGEWMKFFANLNTIVKLRNSYHPQMKVEVFFHLYKHNSGGDLEFMEKFCVENDLQLHPVQAYLIGLDDVLNHLEGASLPEQAQKAEELLRIPLAEGLKKAREEINEPCPADRCILINPDLSVSACMMYYYPQGNIIADNYMELSYDKLLSSIGKTALCHRCKKQAMHRYCQVYSTFTVDHNQPK